MTGIKIVKRRVIELVTCGDYVLTKEAAMELENIYRRAMGWQLPKLDVIISFLKMYGYITEQELRSLNKTTKGDVVNG